MYSPAAMENAPPKRPPKPARTTDRVLDAAPAAEHVIAGDFTRAGAYRAVAELLSSNAGRVPVECVFAVNAEVADRALDLGMPE